ncbi:ABC-F family ATP-binding cassette domain-containing protein [Patescibacteria group bacterium]
MKKIKNPLFTLRNISKDYAGEKLFSDINLTVSFNDRIAIVGPNGIGKSTLLRIIVGLEEPDEGKIVKNKDLRIGYLPQETHWKLLKNTLLQEINSLKENGSNNHYRYKGLVEQFLKNFGFSKESWHRTIKTLSGGERTKLALAKILVSEPNLLVLDEPTNHLDLETIEWLERFLLNWKGAIICVSHDRYFLEKMCDKTFELIKEGLEKYYCPYSEYLKEKDKRFEKKEKEHKQQQKYLKQQQEFINRFRAKACTAGMVKSRIKKLEKLELSEKPKTAKKIKVGFDIGEKTCTKALKIKELIIGKKESPLFRISDKMEVNWGDKIGVIGKNGTGKSTLLKSILGRNQSLKGKIKFGKGIKIGYYAQAHEELDPKKNILEEVSSKTTVEEEKTRNVLGCLLFTQDQVLKKVECLSGGERAKLALAELILQRPNLLLLDEPTNHLDLPSKEVVSDVLKEFKGIILLVSHDRYILNKVCNTIWEIKDGELKKYPGNYEDYRYHLKQY